MAATNETRRAAAESEHTMRTIVSNWIVVIAIALLGLASSGCPALMVGSLGYQGYKYEETGKLPGESSSTASSEKKASPAPTPSPADIE